MLAWRIFAVVLAAVLLAAVVVDIGIDRNREERVLLYDKGNYLGQPDTGIDDATRERVRQRTKQTASGR
jgi:hypothetical protein